MTACGDILLASLTGPEVVWRRPRAISSAMALDLGPFAPARRGATESGRGDLPDTTLADLREMRKGVLE